MLKNLEIQSLPSSPGSTHNEEPEIDHSRQMPFKKMEQDQLLHTSDLQSETDTECVDDMEDEETMSRSTSRLFSNNNAIRAIVSYIYIYIYIYIYMYIYKAHTRQIFSL